MKPSSVDSIRPDGIPTSREETIRHLRPRLLELCGDERSMCRVAAERGLFCRGFRRWHDREFHQRIKPSLGVSTHLNRLQMETLADLWLLSEQLRLDVGLACDAATLGEGFCRGWDELSDRELRDACLELQGRPLQSEQEARTDRGCPAIRSSGLDSDPVCQSTVRAAFSASDSGR